MIFSFFLVFIFFFFVRFVLVCGTVQSTYRRNSEGAVDASVPVPVLELGARGDGLLLQQEPPPPAPPAPPQQPPQPQPPPPTQQPPPQQDVEAALPVKQPSTRKRKTTQNDQSHGSFFLRVGAIGNLQTNRLPTQ